MPQSYTISKLRQLQSNLQLKNRKRGQLYVTGRMGRQDTMMRQASKLMMRSCLSYFQASFKTCLRDVLLRALLCKCPRHRKIKLENLMNDASCCTTGYYIKGVNSSHLNCSTSCALDQ